MHLRGASTIRPVSRRTRHGFVERACLEAIEAADAPITLRSIHAAVEARLGHAVPASSVKSASARLARSRDQPVKRLRPGLCRVVPQRPPPVGQNPLDQCR